MRGFWSKRVDALNQQINDGNGATIALIGFQQPLSNDEIAAAKREGCAGCAWYKASRTRDDIGNCRRNAPIYTEDCYFPPVRLDLWCGEWRQKPEENAP